ncbi:hypothetical protein ACG10_14805 [Azotobacter chroococcum]|nr:hypothetical protein ACG10_14805 [Azotobacter chroococcum]
MLYIDMNEAQVVLMELALSTDGMEFGCRRATVKPFGPEDTPDAVAVEVRQEVPDTKVRSSRPKPVDLRSWETMARSSAVARQASRCGRLERS